MIVWDIVEACRSQLRAGFGGAYALDFGAVLQMGSALGADQALLADVLPAVEDAILAGMFDEGGGDE